MSFKIERRAYADMYGPTVGDRVRLADTDIVIASAKAYINAVNKLRVPRQRMHPQVAGDV
jgi:urease alpha subunit